MTLRLFGGAVVPGQDQPCFGAKEICGGVVAAVLLPAGSRLLSELSLPKIAPAESAIASSL